MKMCTTCKEEKDESCFHKDKTKPNGLYTICSECLKEKRKKNKLIKKEYDKEYALKNHEKVKERRKIYQKNIPKEKRARQNRESRQRHRVSYNKKQLIYINNNKYKFVYRSILNNFIEKCKYKKENSTSSVLGYDYIKFKLRIEMNFKEGMTWENHGKWHVDHKKPVSKFKDGTPPNIVNALCNLQPLWAEENLSKYNKF